MRQKEKRLGQQRLQVQSQRRLLCKRLEPVWGALQVFSGVGTEVGETGNGKTDIPMTGRSRMIEDVIGMKLQENDAQADKETKNGRRRGPKGVPRISNSFFFCLKHLC